jgi:DNA repair exonuclease SbcCD ATPase subunit
MDFQKYLTNLESQLKAVTADISEKQEELEKLKEFRSRVRGGIEVVNQIQSDNPPVPTKEDIRKSVQELAQIPAQQGDGAPMITQ